MLVTLMIAEAVTDHGDGSFSLTRAGITALRQNGQHLSGVLVVYIVGDVEGIGRHTMSLRVTAADGKKLVATAPRSFEFTAAGNRITSFPTLGGRVKPGPCQVVLELDGRPYAYRFDAKP